MEKSSFKLLGTACGQHGQYTFYKALRYNTPLVGAERILALGDFFFLKLWQDSDLLSIGELQLLWTDRVSDQTLASIRLYFLPENTPDGRGSHGQDEVLAINEKVVVRVSELLARVSAGRAWRWGLPAVWRGACARAPHPHAHDAPEPLHASRLDFTDVDKEKAAIEDPDATGVVVFSYPHYCRYRALLRRLEGLQSAWLRDSLVAALGGYAAPSTRTRILFCRDTFEYPELEGHELVCNHLAPRLKGRPRGRRRRRARSHSAQPSERDSDSSAESEREQDKCEVSGASASTPEREGDNCKELSPPKALRSDRGDSEERAADREFLTNLRAFHRDHSTPLKHAHNLKHLRLRSLYQSVVRSGGYEQACRDKSWRRHAALQTGRPASPGRAARARRHYERVLLPFEKYEKRNGSKWWKAPKLQNGTKQSSPKPERKKLLNAVPITTIDITKESPVREIDQTEIPIDKKENIPKLRTPSPERVVINLNSSGNDSVVDEKSEENETKDKPASELNQEFLDSLPKQESPDPPKISVKPVEKLVEKPQEPTFPKAINPPGLTEYLHKQSLTDLSTSLLEMASKQAAETPKPLNDVHNSLLAEIAAKQSLTDGSFFRELAAKQSLGEINTNFLAEIAKAQKDLLSSSSLNSFTGLSDKLVNYATLAAAGLSKGQLPNGTSISVQPVIEKTQPIPAVGTSSPPLRPAGRSSLRNVRVKPTRTASVTPSAPLRPDSASCSPPVTSSGPPPPTNFGINYIGGDRSDRVTSTSAANQHHSDDEIIEVPYKPKTPEIIDLDEYESPGSPAAVKNKKLDILKERGLEVTTLPSEWPTHAALPTPALAAMVHPNSMIGLTPAIQHNIMSQAQFFQLYNFLPVHRNTHEPPKVIQAKSIYGTSGPEKTVYGNPKDPFMPPPHVLQGAPPLKQPRLHTALTAPGPDILDLSSKQGGQKPAVEIVRVPSVPAPVKTVSSTVPQNLSSRSYSLIDGKAVVGSNLEITLVGPKPTQQTTPTKPRPRQKRSSTGQFMSNKTPPNARESPGYKSSPSPTVSTSRIPDFKTKSTNIVIPSYQMSQSSRESDISPTSSTSSRDGGMTAFTSSLLQSAGGSLQQNQAKPPNLAQIMEMQAKSTAQNLASFIDPSVYMNAVYSGLAGQLSGQLSGLSEHLTGQLPGLSEQQLAMYQNLMSSRLMRNYPGLLNMSSVTSTPTSKN